MKVIQILRRKPHVLKYLKFGQIRWRSTFSPNSHDHSWINLGKHNSPNQSTEMRERRKVMGKRGPQENSLRPLQRPSLEFISKESTKISEFIWITESIISNWKICYNITSLQISFKNENKLTEPGERERSDLAVLLLLYTDQPEVTEATL